MNRGRFIGLASLPVLFLGAPNHASEVNPSTPESTPAAAVAHDGWAERWKAAAAELPPRRAAPGELRRTNPAPAAPPAAPVGPTPATALAAAGTAPALADAPAAGM